MGKFLRFGVFFLTSLAFAETAAPPPPVIIRPNLNPNTIQTLDDSKEFFKGSPERDTPKSNRPLGEEPDYDTAQLAEWKEKCEPARKRSMEEYGNCVREEKVKHRRELRQNQDSQQKNRGLIQSPAEKLFDKQRGSDGDFDE